MVEADARTEASSPIEQLLDPFSFFPGVASRIAGLGGNAPGYDHTYAFHTQYVEAEPGRAHFTLNFHGLTARRGTLQLWVHMLPTETGARARVVNSERVQLNRLIQQGGRHAIPFESFHGVSFALHGAIVDDTDGMAESLVIGLDRPADPNNRPETVAEARTSSFGREQTRPDGNLISTAPGTLSRPVSQCATLAQAREEVAATVLKRFGLPAREPVERWRIAYLAQALGCYGMLQQGARGLAFGVAASPLAEALARGGPEIVRAPAGFVADAAPQVAIPADLVNFDFLWSSGVGARIGSSRGMIDFVEASMACLRPGGLAIHILPFDPAGDRRAWPGGSGPFTRNEIERLALAMILRGHEVAQIKIGTGDALWSGIEKDGVPLTEFGVILRRAPSAL